MACQSSTSAVVMGGPCGGQTGRQVMIKESVSCASCWGASVPLCLHFLMGLVWLHRALTHHIRTCTNTHTHINLPTCQTCTHTINHWTLPACTLSLTPSQPLHVNWTTSYTIKYQSGGGVNSYSQSHASLYICLYVSLSLSPCQSVSMPPISLTQKPRHSVVLFSQSCLLFFNGHPNGRAPASLSLA